MQSLEDSYINLSSFTYRLFKSLATDLFQCHTCHRIPREALVCPICNKIYCNDQESNCNKSINLLSLDKKCQSLTCGGMLL